MKEAPGIPVPVIGTLPAFSSVAVAGGASTGGAAVSGSVIVDVMFITTSASINAGTLINQHPERLSDRSGSGQTLKVLAQDDSSFTNIAGGLDFSTSGAGVGIGIVVDVIDKQVTATIGDGTSSRRSAP